MNQHCCKRMNEAVNISCMQHVHEFECPDALVSYLEKFDEYGLIIHDGGSSVLNISFCPWCGAKLPESKRDQWFCELEALGYTEPGEQEIPEKYKSGAWYK